MSAEGEAGEATASLGKRGAARGAVAVFVLFAAVALATLVAAWDDGIEDGQWGRILVVFSSLEALGFAAGGVLIGAAVETPTRRTLEARAKDAEARLAAGADALAEIERDLARSEEEERRGEAEVPETGRSPSPHAAIAARLATLRRMMAPRG